MIACLRRYLDIFFMIIGLSLLLSLFFPQLVLWIADYIDIEETVAAQADLFQTMGYALIASVFLSFFINPGLRKEIEGYLSDYSERFLVALFGTGILGILQMMVISLGGPRLPLIEAGTSLFFAVSFLGIFYTYSSAKSLALIKTGNDSMETDSEKRTKEI